MQLQGKEHFASPLVFTSFILHLLLNSELCYWVFSCRHRHLRAGLVTYDELCFWQPQRIHVFHIPSDMLKLTHPRSPRACFEGFEQFEVSCAHIPSSVRGRRSAAARDLVHSQMALKPWPPSCSCFCVTSRQHCWRSWEYPANGYEWNSEGWVPRACVFSFQAPLVLFVFCRCEVGTTHWTQCNETPVKFARFPVTGLIEGRSYIFRVRAVNKAGVSLPSRVSEPVAALDPADRARLRSKMSFLQLAWEI